MERKRMIQIVVIIVAVLFITSMLTYFGREREVTRPTGEKEEVLMAHGYSEGRIQSYQREMYVYPWGNYSKTVDKLKDEGQIEYINLEAGRGILFLSRAANTTYVRESFWELNSSISAEATIIFDKPINFTFLNGSKKTMFVEPQRIKIDPITPVESKINFSLTADISAGRIENLQLSPIPETRILTVEKELDCGDDYTLEGNINWEEREINLSSYAELLNISERNIKYDENNGVLFSRDLNETEVNEIRNLNLSYVQVITKEYLLVNTTEKEKIEEDLSFISNLTLEFPDSTISASFKSDVGKIEEIKEELEKTISNLIIKRGCSIKMKETEIDGTRYVVERAKQTIVEFVDVEQVKERVDATLEVEIVGRTITNIKILFVQ